MANGDSLTYTENKDGTISVKDTEGKEVRYSKESDLLAVKGSSETAEKKAKENLEARQAEVDTANTNLETTRQQVLQAESKISTLEEQIKEGSGSKEELENVKQELEAAKKSGVELNSKALEYRRQIVVATYGVPADTVKDKTMEELNYYEEALKAVIATKGIGNYAIGGGGGGEGLAGKSPIELARIAYNQPRK